MDYKDKKTIQKKVTFDINEWNTVERRAKECCTNTTAFIRQMAVREPAYFYDAKELAPYLDFMRRISNNVNQIARRANEASSIYYYDLEELRKEVDDLRRMLNTSVFTAPLKTV